MIALGIDIGGTSVKAAARHDDRILWTRQSAGYARPTIQQLTAAIAEACRDVPNTSETGRGKVDGVGLCVPGVLDEHRQRIVHAANLPALGGVSLGELIPYEIMPPQLRPVVLSDTNATAYDLYSTIKPAGRLLVIAIGSGVGASVLDDGVPLFVDGQSPGHIGQLDISLAGNEVIAPDGGRGGVEGYLGAGALRRAYGPDPAAKIRAGDAAFRALVRVVRICHALYRPQHIGLAGGVGIRLGHLLPELRAAVSADLTALARPDWVLFAGSSDFHAAVGAARIASGKTWPQ